MTKEQIKSIGKCNCHRSYCEFFSGAIDEGTSFSSKDIQNLIDELPTPEDISEMREYLKELLK